MSDDKMWDSFCAWAADKETLKKEDELARQEEEVRKRNRPKWISSSWNEPKSDDPYSYHTSESGMSESEVAAKRMRMSPWSSDSTRSEDEQIGETSCQNKTSLLDERSESTDSVVSFKSEKVKKSSSDEKPNLQKLKKSTSCIF